MHATSHPLRRTVTPSYINRCHAQAPRAARTTDQKRPSTTQSAMRLTERTLRSIAHSGVASTAARTGVCSKAGKLCHPAKTPGSFHSSMASPPASPRMGTCRARHVSSFKYHANASTAARNTGHFLNKMIFKNIRMLKCQFTSAASDAAAQVPAPTVRPLHHHHYRVFSGRASPPIASNGLAASLNPTPDATQKFGRVTSAGAKDNHLYNFCPYCGLAVQQVRRGCVDRSRG